jgi:hypothetical protein
MKLRILFAALGLFALVSGWMKTRTRARERLGGSGLGLVEAVLGFALVISQGMNVSAEGTRTAMGWATVVAMIASNVYAISRARRYARGRRASEGHRLYTQIKFRETLGKHGAVEVDPASRGPGT